MAGYLSVFRLGQHFEVVMSTSNLRVSQWLIVLALTALAGCALQPDVREAIDNLLDRLTPHEATETVEPAAIPAETVAQFALLLSK